MKICSVQQEDEPTMTVSFAASHKTNADVHIIAVHKGMTPLTGPTKAAVDALRAMYPDFKGKSGEVAHGVLTSGSGAMRLVLVGLGDAADASDLSIEAAGGRAYHALNGWAVKTICVHAEAPLTPHQAALFANGMAMRHYRFGRYRTAVSRDKDTSNRKIEVVTSKPADAQKAFAPMFAVTKAVHWARDLVNEPPNVLYPESFAKRVVAALKPLGVKVTVIDDEKLDKMGMGAMMAVGKASEHLPRLVIMEWDGRTGGKTTTKGKKASKDRPVALVGKGITFDTGGYSLKPADSMLDMKADMAGAAAVAATMMALAARKAKVHVIGALALAENMVSDEGYRPCDILTSLSGQTIEITNTDAEGRLVLCDTLWHIQETYNPTHILDIATLTGAAMVALGEEYAALFANQDALAKNLETVSAKTGDKVWRMPLDDAFDRMMDSQVADMKNAAATRFGGSCSAACFLQRFIKDGVHWAHIDMAPVMMTKTDQPLAPKGATGFGVRLMTEWACAHAS